MTDEILDIVSKHTQSIGNAKTLEDLARLENKTVKRLETLFSLYGVSVPLPSRKDYDNRKLKPMYFKKDTTVDGKVLYLKGEEYQPYNWNYGRMIGYWHTGRLGYER